MNKIFYLHLPTPDPVPKFLNPVEDFTLHTLENGEETMNLLTLRLIAGALTTPTANMNISIVKGMLKILKFREQSND